MRYAISYVSTAKKELSTKEVDEILTSAEEYNTKNGFTGLLLYSEGNFFQVLEGEKEQVENLFETIKKDSRHFNLIKIFGKCIDKPSYDGYKSDFISENSRYDISRLKNYQHYIEILDKPTQQAIRPILEAFIR